MENAANRIALTGALDTLPEYSHTNHNRNFYRLTLCVERLSGAVDLLPVQIDVGLHLQQALFVLLVGANTIGRHVTFLHFTIFFRLLEVYVKTRNRFYTHNQGSKHRKWYSVFDGGSHLN